MVNGRAFKPSDWTQHGLPIVRIQNLNRQGAKYNHFGGAVEARFLIENGDLLFAWSGTPGTSFGAHVWYGGQAILNQHIFNVHFDRDSIDRDFLKYAINQTLEEQIAKAHGGVGLAHVTKGNFEATQIVLPPLAEQRRIVAKIDKLSGNSKRARDQLDYVPRLVENYKQAVLTNAFSNETFTPKRLGDIVEEGPANGYSPRASTDGSGTLSLKLTATTRGVLDLSEKAVKRIGETIEYGSRYWLEPGDLLIQRSNSLEYVGASAIYEGPRQTYIYPDLMMRVRIENSDVRHFVWRFLNSREARAYFKANATGTAGNMPKINGATVRELLIPLPETPQIAAINKAIKNAFDWIDRLASDASSARKLVDRLDEAILAKAFRGELVPQDPNDEPADILLERIRGIGNRKNPRPSEGRVSRQADGL